MTTLPRFRRSDDAASESPRSIASPSADNAPPDPEASPASTSETSVSPMQEYYQFQTRLYVLTLALIGTIFGATWLAYSLDIALNYLLGASFGAVYLRMMAKDVERLGNVKTKLGNGRLGLFVGLIVVATQLNQLQIVPIFLGFLTYKVAIVVHVLFATFAPTVRSSRQLANR